MKKVVRFSALLLLLFFALAQDTRAQSALGAHLGTNFGGASFGVQLRLGGGALQAAPSVDLSLSQGEDRWQLNGDLIYRLSAQGNATRPYLGAGLGIVQTSGGESTEAGLNTLGGIELNLNFLRPYAQARATFTGGVHLDFMAGLMIRI